MTTIALKNKWVAYDSNSTDINITVLNDGDKLIVDKEGFICFHEGHIESRDGYIDIYKKHKNIWHKNFTFKKILTNEDYYRASFLIVNYNVRVISVLEFIPYSCEGKNELRYSNLILPLGAIYSIGSGRQASYAVMDHGGSAEDSVKIAAMRDIYTGGKINVIDIIEFGRDNFNINLM